LRLFYLSTTPNSPGEARMAEPGGPPFGQFQRPTATCRCSEKPVSRTLPRKQKQSTRIPFFLVLVFLVMLFCVSPVAIHAVTPAQDASQTAADSQLLNAWEVHNEIKVAPEIEAAVKDYFPSFLEYQDVALFHPKFGYYSSGRVSFWGDYQTFPIVLSPYFGHMVTEQIFRMWQGMVHAGTLRPNEQFTIAEFGAGDGAMAESILDYIVREARDRHDKQWTDFANQVLYICYDRSPALNKTQRERNSRFGQRFDAREADATDMTATIRPGSLKGVILSNELPDAFSVHKVILSPNGPAKVAFVVPSLPNQSWDRFKEDLPESVVESVTRGDREIRARFFAGSKNSTYLTRKSFVAFLEALVSTEEYEPAAQSLEFNEIYIPARFVPDLNDHLRRYAKLYATELAKHDAGVVTYVNLGVEKFIQGAGKILNAGYVLTLDYGANWDGLMEQLDVFPQLRTYGPAHTKENAMNSDPKAYPFVSEDRETSDPYDGPTLNDITTDVNFSLMAAEGRLAGLTALFFGPQAALQTGTRVSLGFVPPQRQGNEALVNEFFYWADDFRFNENYKLMVQQKDKTDPEYKYPQPISEQIESDPGTLTEAQRVKADDIEKRLAPTLIPPRRGSAR
jgi:SAM-dependent MidA family methyltransferase